jgi:tRNA pseudouridine32 synthase/23S rRNA pseudouridine746 synthase
MHAQFSDSVSSLLGCPLEGLFPGGIPTGTGDCCAPKLLALAARNSIQPVAMAELWWAPEGTPGRQPGELTPACQERCQPLLGPLLSAALRPPVRVLYQDERLLVVDKPSGLLSVPGRTSWTQDSVLTRLRRRWPGLQPVHRLDLETSGLLVFAFDPRAGGHLRRQFEERQVEKVYLARLSARPAADSGRIEAPLAADPGHPGRYRIDARGRCAVTDYRMLDPSTLTVELRPQTGRSHQLRVHMASTLGCPIRGDRLYGKAGERLQLHAWRVRLTHPGTGLPLELESSSPLG